MKKCTRCSSKLNWNKSYCPICGGMVVEVPDEAVPIVPKPLPSAPESAAPEGEPFSTVEMDDDFAEPIAAEGEKAEQEAVEPLEPVEHLPSLELSDSSGGITKGSGGDAIPSAPKFSSDKVRDAASSSASIEHLEAPSFVSGAPAQGAGDLSGMFEKKAENPVMPLPAQPDDGKAEAKGGSGDSDQGEFLKMFPDARPD